MGSRAATAAWKKRNPEKNRAQVARYRAKYPEKIKARKQKDYRENINYKLSAILRTRLSHLLRRGSAVRDLGCSIPEFKLYIENQFESGMTWENYGKWHLDHVVPLCHFNLTDRMEFLEACNWLNIRPLWAMDNMSRRKKL